MEKQRLEKIPVAVRCLDTMSETHNYYTDFVLPKWRLYVNAIENPDLETVRPGSELLDRAGAEPVVAIEENGALLKARAELQTALELFKNQLLSLSDSPAREQLLELVSNLQAAFKDESNIREEWGGVLINHDILEGATKMSPFVTV